MAIDGIGLKLALGLFGVKIERYHGPELLRRIIDLRAQWSIVIAGGNAANRQLVEDGRVEHYFDLPFTQDCDEIARQLKRDLSEYDASHGPVVLLVSLGLPKQEIVADRLLAEAGGRSQVLGRNLVVVPIGAATDFLTGTKVRAGRAWQKMGLEWLPRLLREPRMFPRVVRSFRGITLLVSSELRSLFARKVSSPVK